MPSTAKCLVCFLAIVGLQTSDAMARQTAGSRVKLFDDAAGDAAPPWDAATMPDFLAAANETGRLAPKLRFARDVLGCDEPWALARAVPHFVSAPLATVLAPRHAYLRLVGARHGPRLSVDDVRAMCLAPGDDDQFVALAADFGGSGADVAAYRALRGAFRRGPREAARRGDATVIEALLHHGWRGTADRDRRGASALHWAAGHGQTSACGALVAGGLGVCDAADDGATPLHWASVGVAGNAFGVGASLEAMRWLADRGARTEAATADGNTCLHWAAWAGGVDAVEFLVRRGADVSALNRNGCHAAHWAAAGGQVATLDYLATLCCGDDLRRPNAAGHTPLEHAVAYGRTQSAEWFLRRGIVDVGAVEYAQRIAGLSDDARRKALATTLAAPFAVPNL
ncbi:ankyrin repeat-containing domain protein [Pelagophyceae sp. CCMP2097]|nr:ankyrin repeat-containing domain protein [Pelagophyceae sp. CCMP2097]